jgi:phosphoglycolate phosphatase-like HAD superfamily hydrolase
MDTKQQIEEVKTQLKAEGFDDNKLNQLLDLAAEDALDTALQDLGNNAPDEIIEQLSKEPDTEIQTQEEAMSRIEKVFATAYGENAEQKKLELILSYLQETLEQTKQAKDLYDRYQAGDPTAVAQVKAQENNPDVDEVVKYMKE